MLTRSCVLLLISVSLLSSARPQQPSSAALAAKSDYSQEAAIVEDMTTKLAFENTGNFTRQQPSRVRVLTDTEVKNWG